MSSKEKTEFEIEGNAPTAITITICLTLIIILFAGSPDLLDCIMLWIKANIDAINNQTNMSYENLY